MISFREDFFLIKFTTLFFILTIFGYWGVDLNSEELYIAFSFFLLVTVAILVFRQTVTSTFLHVVNVKYFRLLSGLLVSVGALTINLIEFQKLGAALRFLIYLLRFYLTFLKDFLFYDLAYLDKIILLRRVWFFSAWPSTYLYSFFTRAQSQRVRSFILSHQRYSFFSININ